jgi:hypothetical protein
LAGNAFGDLGENFDPHRCCLNAKSSGSRLHQQQEPIMARASISLVSISKPSSANNPVLQRRNKFTSSIDQQITKIALFREGKRISREAFWAENGEIFFALRYGKAPLELQKGKSTLKASSWDDLVDQLDQIKVVAVAAGLDEALSACAHAVRSNFSKTTKDKKSGKGS